jgi:predicted  nucleic acid-binding Zn-ribbon protein
METTKEELVTSVKEWIKTDNEISKLKNEIKQHNSKKKILTESLMNIMKKNEIECFDINGGALIYKKNTIKKPISGKTLLTALKKYYENDTKMAEDLAKHLLENREEQVKETIKRKIDK